MEPQPAPAEETAKKKSLFETILTATPIILTVVATFMVGQSTGEMTRAQYYRALASQNQSKVGDQWAFFQAKRIRGTSYEVSADLLSVVKDPVPVTVAEMIELADRLTKEMRTAWKLIDQGGRSDASGIQRAVTQVQDSAKSLRLLLKPVAEKPKFTAAEVEGAFAVMRGESDKAKSAGAEPSKSAGAQDELMEIVLTGIRKRTPESELAPTVLQITDATLDAAIAEADHNADVVSKEGKRAERVLEEIDKLVDAQAAAARKFLRATADYVRSATSDKPSKKELELHADAA